MERSSPQQSDISSTADHCLTITPLTATPVTLPETNVTTTIATFSINRTASNGVETITYNGINCNNNSGSSDASFYLNMKKSDSGKCPPLGIFYSSPNTGYLPVWGSHPNIVDDHGKVAVRHSGECSGPFSDDGPDTPDAWSFRGYDFWDFQIPCKAHDYCYDLMRAGFSGTIKDEDCDNEWKTLMGADCEDRSSAGFGFWDRTLITLTLSYAVGPVIAAILDPLVYRGSPKVLCNKFKDTIYTAVRIGSSWRTSLGEVSISNKGSGLCLNHLMKHNTCYRSSVAQVFNFVPIPRDPGKFYIKLAGYARDRCIKALSSEVIQWGCNTGATMFEIGSADNKAQHLIKLSGKNWCLSVVESYRQNSDLVLDFTCNKNDKWNVWWIVET